MNENFHFFVCVWGEHWQKTQLKKNPPIRVDKAYKLPVCELAVPPELAGCFISSGLHLVFWLFCGPVIPGGSGGVELR